MESRGAVLAEIGAPWAVEQFQVGEPGAGEVLVGWKAAGLCHSDEHFRSGSRTVGAVDPRPPGQILPVLGGHEGAGVVEAVGPTVWGLAVGDRVCASFLAPCGRCAHCASGRQYLCGTVKRYKASGQLTDGVVRHRLGGKELQVMSKLGTFSERSVVAEQSLVKIDGDIPFAAAALISCGVATGWGAATERAGTVTGDVVVVVGVGGVGVSAVQGAHASGASAVVAVDPVAFRREAALRLGATDAAVDIEQAKAVVDRLTDGGGAHRVVVTVSASDPALLYDALSLTSQGGVCVMAGLGGSGRVQVDLDLYSLATANKEIRGCMYGSLNPTEAIPRLSRLYSAGVLKLDEMITSYPLADINRGYADMLAGRNVRGVVLIDEAG